MIDEEALRSIEKLHQMKQEGIISESDFDAAKQDILKGRARPKPRSQKPNAYTHPVAGNDYSLPNDGDFIEWIMLPLKKYADFTGRSGRREFWMFQILVTAVSFVFFISIPELYKTTNLLFAAVSGMALLALAVPQIALQVRRFHDQDKSGWFALFNLFPYIGPVIVLIFMLIGGTRWENRYGPDPYER